MEKITEKSEERAIEHLETLHEAQEEKKITHITVVRDLTYAPKQYFLPGKAKDIIRATLRERLSGIIYDGEAASGWVRDIVDTIKNRLKEMEYERYKIVVQATIGEKRGQGFNMACRCFWDPNTDDYAEETFTNEDIFGVAVAFAVYQY
ncbi:hypothetical protein GOP47_0009941 [Adiantum capillus-veneris]|uniref:Tctex1 domain-containing protein 2 n=1 Tax=Adiantum capillus-veneris TaxID=13818 RepID=A0A9D4ZK62_ADICA|nr:hypothetical protein GOP47_0009941 [Adiantum capillus-veneris]